MNKPPDAAVLAELILGIPKDAFPVVLMIVIALLVRDNVRHCHLQELFKLLARWSVSDAVLFAQNMSDMCLHAVQLIEHAGGGPSASMVGRACCSSNVDIHGR